MFKSAIIGVTMAVALGGTAMAQPSITIRPADTVPAAELQLVRDGHGHGRKYGHYKHKYKHHHKYRHHDGHRYGHRDWHRPRGWRYGHDRDWRWRHGPTPYYAWPPAYGSSTWAWY